jgi:hypothetical protein
VVNEAIASLPLLWIFAALSVSIKLNLRNASLPIRARLGVPKSRLQHDSAEFLHCHAAPTTHPFGKRPQAAVTGSSKLITERVPLALLAPAQ